MKFSWLKKKLTFVIIPDANRSVMRFRIANPVLVFIPFLLFVLVTTLVVIYFLHQHSLSLNQQLQMELAKKEKEFGEVLAEKNTLIEDLQNDVITLSNQAEEISQMVEELKALESEIKGLTEPIATNSKPVTIASQDDLLRTEDGDVLDTSQIGGVFIELSDQDISELALHTSLEFIQLDKEMNELYENLSIAKDKILAYQEKLRITPSIWPTESRRVTSSFGYRRDPFTGRPSYHSGIDIGGKLNDPVYATADGVVIHVGYDRGHGNHITIDHSGGIRTKYMHLNKTLVKKGQQVKKGDTIGLLGSTGRSTGPHLHYEVIINGVHVDPKPYM